MEQFNQSALADLLLEIAEILESTILEVERLAGTIREDDRLRERYLAGVKRSDFDTREAAIRLLRQRLSAISLGVETVDCSCTIGLHLPSIHPIDFLARLLDKGIHRRWQLTRS